MATHFSGPVHSTSGFVGSITGNLTGDIQANVAAYSANGAITQKQGKVYITKGTAAAMTLAAPTATTDDGKQLVIVSTTAAAHTVTNSSPGFNNGGASKDVATAGGAIGDYLVLEAYQGVWYIVGNSGFTLA